MGLLKIVLSIVGTLVLAVIGLGIFLYVTDYEVQATITEKEGREITIRPKIVPRDFQHTLDSKIAPYVCEGYTVKYALRSGYYLVYDQQDELFYDSRDGQPDSVAGLVPCDPSGGIPGI